MNDFFEEHRTEFAVATFVVVCTFLFMAPFLLVSLWADDRCWVHPSELPEGEFKALDSRTIEIYIDKQRTEVLEILIESPEVCS